jgi:hypothetical protein
MSITYLRANEHYSTLRATEHHSTLHAFLLAAKAHGCIKFQLDLIPNPNGRIEFHISSQQYSELSACFELRGNMVRAATAKAANIAPITDAEFYFGGTRSGEGVTRSAVE